MKENLITAIISCLITSYVWAEVIPREKEVIEVVRVEKYKVDKYKLAEAFAYVESGNNPKAVNKHTKATGVLQIMPIMVEEANRLAGYKKYRLSDRTSKKKSFELFHFIMQHKNPEYDIALACYIWNPNGKVKYVRDIEKKYKELIVK